MTVDACGVVLAVLADGAASSIAVDVDAEALSVHLSVVMALVGVAVAVALLALEWVVSGESNTKKYGN